MATNTETYIFQQMFARPQEVTYPTSSLGTLGVVTNVTLEEYKPDGTLVSITTPCPTTGVIRVSASFSTLVSVLGVGVETVNYNGGNVATTSSACPPGVICTGTLSEAPQITNISPYYSPTTSLTFDLNYPLLQAAEDSELLLKFTYK